MINMHCLNSMKYTKRTYSRNRLMSCLFAAGFVFILAISLWSCQLSTLMEEAGGAFVEGVSDVNIFTTEQERQLGKSFDEQHARKVSFYTDPIVTNYINNLGQRLVRKSKRSNIPYTFRVVNTNAINAYAVPGGYIYVNLGLIRAVKTESELAFVIAHEIGHIVGKHGMKRLTQIYGIEILKKIIIDDESSQTKKLVADILAAGWLFKYSRDNERESDFYGVRNVYDAGISPQGGIHFFETLQQLQRREPTALEQLLSTHPVHSERIENVRKQIRRLPPKPGLKENSYSFQMVKRRVR